MRMAFTILNPLIAKSPNINSVICHQRIDMSIILNGGLNGIDSCFDCTSMTAKPEEELDTQVQW